MKKFNLKVKTKNKNYSIIIGENILGKTGKYINSALPNCKKIALVVDANIPPAKVFKLKNSLKKYNCFTIKINTNEKIKNLETVNKLINILLKKNFYRDDCLIAFGGGVLGDIVSLTANLIKRGIKFINIPSTFLSQVDSSIGGKTGVNSKYGKNMIGTFYQPELVISDTSCLTSLPKREIICGYAEILKHSLILDRKFFLWLQKNGKKILNIKSKLLVQKAIFKSCKIKTKIIEKDEREKNLRMILNFGHTFAHAFEATKNFSKKINHGESVLLGMICAGEFAVEKGMLKKTELELMKKHYLILNLPTVLKKYFRKRDVKNIIKFMQSDKKNYNFKIRLILINKIGKTLRPKVFNKLSIAKYLNSKLQ